MQKWPSLIFLISLKIILKNKKEQGWANRQVYSLLTLFGHPQNTGGDRGNQKGTILAHFHDLLNPAPCAPTSHTQATLRGSTLQLTLRYDSSHWHGTLFLHELDRSTEMSKFAYSSLRLRKPQVWNSTNKSDPIKPMTAVKMLCALYTRILIASSHLQMCMQARRSKFPKTTISVNAWYERGTIEVWNILVEFEAHWWAEVGGMDAMIDDDSS